MLSLCNWVTKVLDPRTKYILNYHCRESRGTWPGHTATTGAGKVQKSTITQLNYVNNKWTCSSQIKRHTVYTYSSLVQNENTSKLNLRHLTKTKKSYNSNVMCECVWCINTDLKQRNKLLSKRDKTNTNYEYGIWLEWKLYLHRITTEPPDAASVQPNTWRWVIHDANWVAHERIWGGPKRTLQWPSNALYMYCGGRGEQVAGRESLPAIPHSYTQTPKTRAAWLAQHHTAQPTDSPLTLRTLRLETTSQHYHTRAENLILYITWAEQTRSPTGPNDAMTNSITTDEKILL